MDRLFLRWLQRLLPLRTRDFRTHIIRVTNKGNKGSALKKKKKSNREDQGTWLITYLPWPEIT